MLVLSRLRRVRCHYGIKRRVAHNASYAQFGKNAKNPSGI